MNALDDIGAPVQPFAVRAVRAAFNGFWLASASLVSFELSTNMLAQLRFVSRDNQLLGGMWAVAATIFAFRETFDQSARAALSRIMATSWSFALCLLYLSLFAFHVWGLALVLGTGAVVLSIIGRSGEIITTGITSAVILVVAAISPEEAWRQPIFRLVDTLLGIIVGILAARAAKGFAFGRSGKAKPWPKSADRRPRSSGGL